MKRDTGDYWKELRDLIIKEKNREFPEESSIMDLELYCVSNDLENEQKEIWEKFKKDFPKADSRGIKNYPKMTKEERTYLKDCEKYDFDRDLCRVGIHWSECNKECKYYNVIKKVNNNYPKCKHKLEQYKPIGREKVVYLCSECQATIIIIHCKRCFSKRLIGRSGTNENGLWRNKWKCLDCGSKWCEVELK